MMNTNKYSPPGCIRTFTGKDIDPLLITSDQIDIRDICVSLSRQCRFGGHSKKNYTVAQHSHWVARKIIFDTGDYDLAFAGLLHDATEAYMLDLPKPIKDEIPRYSQIEDWVKCAIADKFIIHLDDFSAVKPFDEAAFEWEWERLVIANRVEVPCWSHPTSALEFKKMFRHLCSKTGREFKWN